MSEVEARAAEAAGYRDGVVRALWVCAGVTCLVPVVALFGDDRRGWVLAVLGGLGVCYVVAGVRWLRWFASLYAAVRAAGRARFRTRGIAIWSWLVPLVQLVLPYLLVNDVWRAAEPPGGKPAPRPLVLPLWWAGWVASYLFAPRGTGLLTALGGLVFVADAVLATRVVPLLTDRVRRLAADGGDGAAAVRGRAVADPC